MYFQITTIKQEHFCILKNIQDCHNAMAAGSPTDLLIRSTDRPDIPDEDSISIQVCTGRSAECDDLPVKLRSMLISSVRILCE